MNLIETEVNDNLLARFGAVATLHRATTGMSFCCFSRNSALVRGIVFVDKSSNSTFARNSFGSENSVRLSDCNSVFLEQEGSCFDTGDCQGDCLPFDSRTCRIDVLSGNATLIPTSSPTASDPSGAPTQNGGDGGGFVGSIGFILLMVFLSLGCCLCAAVGGFFVYRWRSNRGEASGGEVQPLVEEPDKEKGYNADLDSSWNNTRKNDTDNDSDSSESTDNLAPDSDDPDEYDEGSYKDEDDRMDDDDDEDDDERDGRGAGNDDNAGNDDGNSNNIDDDYGVGRDYNNGDNSFRGSERFDV